MKTILLPVIALFSFLCSCASAPGPNNTGGGGSSSSAMALGVYVATNGSDTNAGTNASEPMKTIQRAVSNAVTNGLTNIYIATGVYKPGSGLNITNRGLMLTNNNLNFYGGYSADFSTRSGMSELDGTNGLEHVIFLESSTNILMDGFVIRGGNSISDGYFSGGGVYYNQCAYCMLTNSVISNNGCMASGGGVAIVLSSRVALSATIVSNYSTSSGGGIYISGGYSNTVNSVVRLNTGAIGDGGGIYISSSSFNSIGGSILSNTCQEKGGGIYLGGSYSNTVNADVLWNRSTNNYGGGIYNDGCDFLVLSGNISSNYTTNASLGRGGGIYSTGYNTLITNAVIRYNQAVLGGGIYIEGPSTNVKIFADISFNYASGAAGGMYVMMSTNVLINSSFISNSSDEAGAIMLNYGSNYSVFGTLNGNVAKSIVGAMEVYGSFDTLISATIINNMTSNNYGGMMYTHNCTNLSIVNSLITNNYASSPDSIFSIGTTAGLVVTNCIIGGANNISSYAFYEVYSDTTGQIINNNVFLTNKLRYLYYDFGGSHLVNNDAGWTNINVEVNSGAATADNNTVQ